MKLLTIVTTFYKSENYVELFIDEVSKVIEQQLGLTKDLFSIIAVIDASPDDSFLKVKECTKKYSNLEYISFFKNTGQQKAMSAGIHHSNAEIVIILDSDFENPISEIPVVYNKLKCSDADICYVTSNNRQNFLRKLSSTLFYFTFNKVFKIGIIKDQLMMRGMKYQFVNAFKTFEETNRTIGGICHNIGGNIVIHKSSLNKRVKGKSSYNFFSRLEVYLDILINMTEKPLTYLFYLGLFVLTVSCLLGANTLYIYFTKGSVNGYISLVSLILFFNSVLILFLSLISKYIVTVYKESQHRPLYLIKETNIKI